MITDFFQRLFHKLQSLLPMVLAAAVLTLLLSGLVWLLQMWGPAWISHWLDTLSAGDWTSRQQQIRGLFQEMGSWAPVGFFLVQLAQVLFAPIPGQLTGILGGFLFGFWPGLGLTMLGLTLGSWLAIVLARWLGDHVVHRFVPPEVMARFDRLLLAGTVTDFFMIFLLPALPDDAICFMAGLTRLPVWKLILACLLGRLPGMAVLTFVGSSGSQNQDLAQWILTGAMVAALLVWLYEDVFYHLVNRQQNQT
ncbi:MAG: VTT domain-containing protein [Magnetococcales bacterium]|nr:VTT domain-containing protein [Magnetococcales bacterium]NGZ26926.1 VTT domain-containing protein [Magnetococcales bacterium]